MVDTEAGESPVIELKPVYAGNEELGWNESMVQ
jgi:hypothetical protein